MDRDEEDIGVLMEDVFGSVAVVHIPVDDGDLLQALALLRMARDKGLQDVCLHIIFDGRSTPPGSAPALLQKLEQSMTEIGIGQVVSGVGRGIALDRDGNYAKIQKAYEAMVLGHGEVYR